MEYLPTFALKITQMWVNIPYMEHMGMRNSIRCTKMAAAMKGTGEV
jgi:hypothetical protein